jgi:hypothetical protein
VSYYSFRPYVPVAKRRAIAARELEKLRKKGRKILPVVLEGRSIARTFWGKAWCENLERYSEPMFAMAQSSICRSRAVKSGRR